MKEDKMIRLLLVSLLGAHWCIWQAHARNLDAIPAAPSGQRGALRAPAATSGPVRAFVVAPAPSRLANLQQSVMNPSMRGPRPLQPVSFYQVSMCQLPAHLLAGSKCKADQEAELKQIALKDFQARLEESSLELRLLLHSYWDEFTRLALDLVLVARNGTLSRLHQLHLDDWQLSQHEQAVRRLFDTMQLYLSPQQHLETALDFGLQRLAELNSELSLFFRRLLLLQVKRVLDGRLGVGGRELDLDCLSANLASDGALERLLSALKMPPLDQIQANQSKLVQSIRKSLEFARTLLSSLGLTNEMFQNLTQRTQDWIPRSSCELALARMSVCPQCYPSGAATSQQAPCEPFCLNVIRGCMNDIYELDRFWSEHVNALAAFKTNMIQTNNIENVFSNLDEKLIEFIVNLQQPMWTMNNNSASKKSNSFQEASQQQVLNEQQMSSAELVSSLCQRSHQARPHQHQRPAALLLPATHPRGPAQPAHHGPPGLMALRARSSPSFSLFNRLDGLVSELEQWRSFFGAWPQRLCARLSRQRAQRAPANSTECWNGRDFTGYNKPLIPYGQAITSSHPEVPKTQSSPYDMMVLNFIAKLKDIRAQLVRKSVQHPGLLLSQPLVSGKEDSSADQDATKRAAAAAAAAALSSAGSDQDELEPEASAPTSSLLSVAQSQPDDESDEDPGDPDGEDSDADDVPEPDPECNEGDCSDLNMDHQQAAGDLTSGAHSTTDIDTNHPPQILVQEGQQQVPPYQVPDEPAHLPPVGTNDLFPLIQVQPEFIERQINAADRATSSSSSWLLVAILLASIALIVLTLRICERIINQVNEVDQV